MTQTSEKLNTVVPFLRWAGGKRWLSQKIAPILKERLYGRYFEPFIGAGAMFFSIAPKRALLSDINTDLINSFQIVKEKPDELVGDVRKLPVDADTYYRCRSSRPNTPLSKAVRFIYLNRTCYGGLYRENKKGEFNTPFGGGSRTPNPLWEQELIKNANTLLSGDHIHCRAQDFSKSMRQAKKGDVIYCDPTYRAVTRKQFDRYGSNIFDWSDQKRLAEEAIKAYHKQVLVIISNANNREIKELYPDGLFVELSRNRGIGNKQNIGIQRKELLIILDPINEYKIWMMIEPKVLYN